MLISGRYRSAEAVLRRFITTDSNRNVQCLIQASRILEAKNNPGKAKKYGKRWNGIDQHLL